MVEVAIKGLILICAAVLVFFLAIWVLGMLGLALPGMVIKILGIILVLIVILLLWRMLVAAGVI